MFSQCRPAPASRALAPTSAPATIDSTTTGQEVVVPSNRCRRSLTVPSCPDHQSAPSLPGSRLFYSELRFAGILASIHLDRRHVSSVWATTLAADQHDDCATVRTYRTTARHRSDSHMTTQFPPGPLDGRPPPAGLPPPPRQRITTTTAALAAIAAILVVASSPLLYVFVPRDTTTIARYAQQTSPSPTRPSSTHCHTHSPPPAKQSPKPEPATRPSSKPSFAAANPQPPQPLGTDHRASEPPKSTPHRHPAPKPSPPHYKSPTTTTRSGQPPAPIRSTPAPRSPSTNPRDPLCLQAATQKPARTRHRHHRHHRFDPNVTINLQRRLQTGPGAGTTSSIHQVDDRIQHGQTGRTYVASTASKNRRRHHPGNRGGGDTAIGLGRTQDRETPIPRRAKRSDMWVLAYDPDGATASGPTGASSIT